MEAATVYESRAPEHASLWKVVDLAAIRQVDGVDTLATEPGGQEEGERPPVLRASRASLSSTLKGRSSARFIV